MEKKVKKKSDFPLLTLLLGLVYMMIALSAVNKYPYYWGDWDFIAYFGICCVSILYGIIGLIINKVKYGTG